MRDCVGMLWQDIQYKHISQIKWTSVENTENTLSPLSPQVCRTYGHYTETAVHMAGFVEEETHHM